MPVDLVLDPMALRLRVQIHTDAQRLPADICGVKLDRFGERAAKLGRQRDAVGDGEPGILPRILHQANEIPGPAFGLE